LLSQGESRYRRYHDKSWSLTDCISMELLRQRRLSDVASTDRGFRQAGFRVLMP
jgi:predicted nucleic acid-binding protein